MPARTPTLSPHQLVALWPQWQPALHALLHRAGDVLLRYWQQPMAHQHKADGSPVSAADMEANTCVEAGLRALHPDIPIISEEGLLDLPADCACYWLLDPLDGTRGFLRGEPDFAISLALIISGQPVLGLLHAPAQHWLMMGLVGHGAWQWHAEGEAEPILLSPYQHNPSGLHVLVASGGKTPMVDAYFQHVPIASRQSCASAVKFMRIARGEADMYPRIGTTQQWDIAAGNAIVRAAGGECVGLEATPLVYGYSATHAWEHAPFFVGRAGAYAALQQWRGGTHG